MMLAMYGSLALRVPNVRYSTVMRRPSKRSTVSRPRLPSPLDNARDRLLSLHRPLPDDRAEQLFERAAEQRARTPVRGHVVAVVVPDEEPDLGREDGVAEQRELDLRVREDLGRLALHPLKVLGATASGNAGLPLRPARSDHSVHAERPQLPDAVTISARRLDLVPMSAAFIDALLE